MDVSIVTSFYKSEAFVPEFIRSINSQTYLEVGKIYWIFVDASPSIEMEAIITDRSLFHKNVEPVYVSHNAGATVGAAWKAGVDNTETPVFIKCDIDDRLSSYGVEILVREFLGLKGVGAVYGREFFSESSKATFEESKVKNIHDPKLLTTPKDLFEGYTDFHQQIGHIILFSTEMVKYVGNFSPRLLFYADYDMVIKLLIGSKVIKTEQVVGSHYINPLGLFNQPVQDMLRRRVLEENYLTNLKDSLVIKDGV